MAILRKFDYCIFACPCCGRRIRVDRIQGFAARWSTRRAFRCPRCANWVIFAAPAYGMVNGGLAALLILLISYPWPPAVIACGLVACAGFAAQRLIPLYSKHPAEIHRHRAA